MATKGGEKKKLQATSKSPVREIQYECERASSHDALMPPQHILEAAIPPRDLISVTDREKNT